MERTRIVLIDMSPLLREIVRGILAREPDLEIVGEHDDATDVADAVEREEPDFVIVGSDGAGEERLRTLVDSGRGRVVAPQFQIGTASVSISGVGNADLWVTDELKVDISGAGHVRYSGSPKVRQSISGLGSVDANGDKR